MDPSLDTCISFCHSNNEGVEAEWSLEYFDLGEILNCGLDIVMILKNLLQFDWKGDGAHFFFVSFWLRNNATNHLAQCNNICPWSSLDAA